MTEIEKDAAHVLAVTAKLAGPQHVYVLMLDNTDQGQTDVEGVFGSEKRMDRAALAWIEEQFDSDNIDVDERKLLIKAWKADGRCEIQTAFVLYSQHWQVMP